MATETFPTSIQGAMRKAIAHLETAKTASSHAESLEHMDLAHAMIRYALGTEL